MTPRVRKRFEDAPLVLTVQKLDKVFGNLRPFRQRIQMIFQERYASLNPHSKVDRSISEDPIIHGMAEVAS